MRQLTSLLIMTLAIATTAKAQPQVDFNDPQWASYGATAEEREKNLFAASYMKDAISIRDFNAAAGYFQQIIASAPAAAPAIYQRALILYRSKIRAAKSLAEKKTMVDSLILVHDMRLKYFGSHPTQGRPVILENKARDYREFNSNDREGLRQSFREAIDESDGQIDLSFVDIYFKNLIMDYEMDILMAEDVITEYYRLRPLFENLPEDKEELLVQFDRNFATSGVASCENIEKIIKERLEANPNDEKILSQALSIMGRAGCRSPFYIEISERHYRINPSSSAAMTLATTFQNDGDFDKASKYLRDALATESDIENQEALYSRIALVELAASRMDAALAAAKAAVAINDGTAADNGVALFVIAQVYGDSAAKCSGLDSQIAYLAAYDAIAKALKNFTEEEQSYQAPATALMSQYKAYFPTKEECFFNEIEVGGSISVTCGVAKGVKTVVRTRD